MIYNKIGISEGTNFNKTSTSKGCIICHYWYFLNKEFRFQPTICSGCHDVLTVTRHEKYYYSKYSWY